QETLSPGFINAGGYTQGMMQLASHIAEHQQAMKSGGGSINMIGRGAPTGPNMAVGSANPQMPALGGQSVGQGPTNPASNPAQGLLAGLLNTGGTNLG
ncbi:MAG: hypothetical protein Q8P12_00725, partial [bacterium]|nr:hypothetical protein [bacterium]